PVTVSAIQDDRFGNLLSVAQAQNGGNPITLAAGASFTFTLASSLTLDGGQSHVNVVTVMAVDNEGDQATATDDHVVTGTDVAPGRATPMWPPSPRWTMKVTSPSPATITLSSEPTSRRPSL